MKMMFGNCPPTLAKSRLDGVPAVSMAFWRIAWRVVLSAVWVNLTSSSGVLALDTPSIQLEAHRPANCLKLSPCGAAIKESVKHSPAFGTLHVKLGPGAEFRAEAGAMVAMQVL